MTGFIHRGKEHFKKRKKAVSPLVSTIILISVVIVIGGAAWTYANTAVSTTLSAQGEQVAKDVNTIRERYSIVNVQVIRGAYAPPYPDNMTIWIYNRGGVDSIVWEVWASNSTSFDTPISQAQYLPPSSYHNVKVDVGELEQVVMRLDTSGWNEINVKVLGQHGNVFTYSQGCFDDDVC